MQQNASLVEEATAATESMKEQAASLLQLVSRFKLGGEQSDFIELQAVAPRSAPAWTAAPAPIKVRSDPAKLAHSFAALGVPHKPSGNGEWKEF